MNVEEKIVRAFIGELPQLLQDEGCYPETYSDSLGYPTCGVGCLLKPGHPLYGAPDGTPVDADRMLRDLFGELTELVLPDIRRKFSDEMILAMPLDCLQILVNLLFNMGSRLYRKFPSATAAFQRRDWERAALEMTYKDGLNPAKGHSDWWGQVKTRAPRIVNRIRALPAGHQMPVAMP